MQKPSPQSQVDGDANPIFNVNFLSHCSKLFHTLVASHSVSKVSKILAIKDSVHNGLPCSKGGRSSQCPTQGRHLICHIHHMHNVDPQTFPVGDLLWPVFMAVCWLHKSCATNKDHSLSLWPIPSISVSKAQIHEFCMFLWIWVPLSLSTVSQKLSQHSNIHIVAAPLGHHWGTGVWHCAFQSVSQSELKLTVWKLNDWVKRLTVRFQMVGLNFQWMSAPSNGWVINFSLSHMWLCHNEHAFWYMGQIFNDLVAHATYLDQVNCNVEALLDPRFYLSRRLALDQSTAVRRRHDPIPNAHHVFAPKFWDWSHGGTCPKQLLAASGRWQSADEAANGQERTESWK